jgi:hypothetical protein
VQIIIVGTLVALAFGAFTTYLIAELIPSAVLQSAGGNGRYGTLAESGSNAARDRLEQRLRPDRHWNGVPANRRRWHAKHLRSTTRQLSSISEVCINSRSR